MNRAILALVASMVAMSTHAIAADGWIGFIPPAQVWGPSDLQAPQAYAAFYGSAEGVRAAWSIAAPRISFDLIEETSHHVLLPAAHTTIPSQPADRRVTSYELRNVRAWIEDPDQNLTLAIRADSIGATFASEVEIQNPKSGIMLASSSRAPSTHTLEPFETNSEGWPNVAYFVAAGTNHHISANGLTISGNDRGAFYLAGVTLWIENETDRFQLDLRASLERAPNDPTGLSTVHGRVHRAAVQGFFEGQVQLSYEGPHAHILAPSAVIRNITQLSAPLGVSEVWTESGTYTLTNDTHLDIHGNFQMELAPPEEASNVLWADLDGDITRIHEDRVLQHDLLVRPAAVTAVTLLLVAIAIVSFIRKGLAFVAAKWLAAGGLTWLSGLTRRRHEGKFNATRHRVLDSLRDDAPYVRLSRFLSKTSHSLGVHRLTVYHHLRVLHGQGEIDVLKPRGRHCIYVAINHGHIEDSAVKVSMALLESNVGNLVARALCLNPGAAQSEIIDYVQSSMRREAGRPSAISRVAIHKWIKRFEFFEVDYEHRRLGNRATTGSEPKHTRPVKLVDVLRRGGRVRYFPTPSLRTAVALAKRQGSS